MIDCAFRMDLPLLGFSDEALLLISCRCMLCAASSLRVIVDLFEDFVRTVAQLRGKRSRGGRGQTRVSPHLHGEKTVLGW